MSAVYWLGLVLLLAIVLALDLGLFHRDSKAQTTSEALLWSVGWVTLAFLFNGFVYLAYEHHWLGIGLEIGEALDGEQAAIQFLTAYLIEKSLSLDNVFVIAMVFTSFSIPLEHQHRVLFWGVLGALVMRAVFIIAGLELVERFEWTTYLFGFLLLATALKMLVDRHDDLEPGRNKLVSLARRWLPVTAALHGGAFVVRENGVRSATPLLLALLVVEGSDLLFAVDSLPAVIAVTTDPFLAFSSNAFAVLGLRSLYFVMAPLLSRFLYLKTSLIFVLAFIGSKMLLAQHHPIPASVSLGCIVGILGVGVVSSVIGARRGTVLVPSPAEAEIDRLMLTSVRGARRVVVAVAGLTAIGIGVAMLLLPGPGIVVIAIGLAVLSTEFVWAKRWLARLREAAARHLPSRDRSGR